MYDDGQKMIKELTESVKKERKKRVNKASEESTSKQRL
jgi:hypothetical protein